MTEFSNNQIKKLGRKIRENNNLSDKDLKKLQQYRELFQKPLSHTFNDLSILSKRVYTESIASMRLKRIDTIIRKLYRFEKMELHRMGDIAGCRFIMKNERQIRKLSKLIEKKYTVKKTKDYLKNVTKKGYRGLHLFIKSKTSPSRIIELQIRTKEAHNWATLVEIIDFLYEDVAKESVNMEDADFANFHKLLSNNIDDLSLKEKRYIIKIAIEHKLYSTLSRNFIKNYIPVRNQWENTIKDKKKIFFIINTIKDKIPQINSFYSYEKAENEYFKLYSTQKEESNILLTHLSNLKYEQISIAYSNYLLTMHAFFYEYISLLQSVIIELISNGRFLILKRYLLEYYNIIIQAQNELNIENKNILKNLNKKPKIEIKKNINRWKNELDNRVKKLKIEQIKFFKKVLEKKPNDWISNYILKFIFMRVEKKIKNNETNII